MRPMASSSGRAPQRTSERLEVPAESADEAPNVFAAAMFVEAGKAGPAKAEAQIVDERQFVPLVGEHGVRAVERQLNRVGRPAADIRLVQVVGRERQPEGIDEIGIGLFALLLPLLEQIRDDARRL